MIWHTISYSAMFIRKVISLIIIFMLLSILFSFLLVPLFGIHGIAENSTIDVQNCYVTTINLPIVANNFTNTYVEIEPNSPNLLATGPLINGRVYNGKINDEKDYYSVYLPNDTLMLITLWNDDGPDDKLEKEHVLQLQLFYTGAQQIPVSVAHRAAADIKSPYSIQNFSQAGWYYIYVNTPNNHNDTHYGLRITYPTSMPNTPVPTLPKCTATTTPSPTPSITPSQTPMTLCEFESISAGFSVLFPTGTAGHIWADDKEEDAMITAVSLTPISPGFYQVTMYSYDNHTAKPHQNQPDEIWTLRLKNEAGTIIATAGPSIDIPDGAGNDCQPTYLENMLILTDTAVSAEAYHAAYPAPDKNPNSVNPDYALLIPVRMVAPPPTRTPLPPHLATPTP